MLVTVIIPTYNRAAYLCEAITSVLRQTYTDVEVIVADDGSTDETEAVVRGFDDARLVYVRAPQNRGMLRNTIAGCRRARGELVANLHDDDVWEPELLATLVPPLAADDGLSLAFADHAVIDAEGRLDDEASDRAERRWGRDTLPRGVHQPFCELALVRLSVPIVSCVFRASAIDWDDFPDDVGSAYDLWLFYLACRDGRGAYYDPARLARYRVHPGAETAVQRRRMSRAGVASRRRFLADRRLDALHEPIRRQLAASYASFGSASLEAGDVGTGRQAFRRALATKPTPRVAAAAVAALVAPRLSRRVLAFVKSQRAG